jgi:hypothetical protein
MTIISHISRRVCYTEEQLDRLAQEFAEYAALDIADILKLNLPRAEQDYRLALIATEVAHAIRCTITTLTVTPAPARPYRSPRPREPGELKALQARTA